MVGRAERERREPISLDARRSKGIASEDLGLPEPAGDLPGVLDIRSGQPMHTRDDAKRIKRNLFNSEWGQRVRERGYKIRFGPHDVSNLKVYLIPLALLGAGYGIHRLRRSRKEKREEQTEGKN